MAGKLWVDKYKPWKLEQVCGNDGPIEALMDWLKAWPGEKGPSYRGAFVHGPAGIGKTTAVTLVVKAAGYRALELNASDTRSGKALKERLPDARFNPFVSARPGGGGGGAGLAIIMDEADGLCGTSDKGATKTLTALIKSHAYPVIMIANDPYANDTVKGLFRASQVFRFYPPRGAHLADRLLPIARAEGLAYPSNAYEAAKLADQLGGDMRACITHLYMQSLSKTKAGVPTAGGDRDVDVFESFGGLWSAQGRAGFVDRCIDVYKDDGFLVTAFMQEHYLKAVGQTRDIEEAKQRAAAAADALSLGDILFTKVNTEIMGAMVVARTCAATGPRGPHRLEFPKALGEDSKRNARKKRMLALLDKVSPGLGARANPFDGWFDVLGARLFGQLARPGCDVKDIAQWMANAGLTSDDWKTLAADGWLGIKRMPPRAAFAFGVTPALPHIETETKGALTRALKKCKKIPLTMPIEVTEPPSSKRMKTFIDDDWNPYTLENMQVEK